MPEKDSDAKFAPIAKAASALSSEALSKVLRHRKLLIVLVHIAAFSVSLFLAFVLAFNMQLLRAWFIYQFPFLLAIAIPIKLEMFRRFKQYQGWWQYVGISDLIGNFGSFLKPEFPGVTEPRTGLSMGESTELMAKEWDVQREHQDQLALSSHVKAAGAYDAGWFDDLVVPYQGAEEDNRQGPSSRMREVELDDGMGGGTRDIVLEPEAPSTGGGDEKGSDPLAFGIISFSEPEADPLGTDDSVDVRGV